MVTIVASTLLGAIFASNAAAQQLTSLSSYDWMLQNSLFHINISASFPSYAHLDLAANQVVGQLEYGLNDFNLRWIWQNNWTYLTHLSELDKTADQTILLFQGLDTFSTIELCGQHVASTNNQFRQYYFNITDVLSNCTGDALLSLNFGSAPSIAAAIAAEPGQETWPYGVEGLFEIPNRQFIRKQQNDFGWDWGPAYAPAGPWQPGYVIQMKSTDVVARNTLIDAYRLGQRNNMIPDQTQPWVVNASIDLIGTAPSTATLAYTLKDSSNRTVSSGLLSNISQVNGAITGSTMLSDGSVDLWWPVGMGAQTLYYLTVDVMGSDNSTMTSVTRRMGFRTIVLNELPISDADLALGIVPGNNWHFEINGHPFYAKGSNFIPPDVFWPRVTPDSIRTLFNSVVDGNQNMLRVWSSGAYSPDFMYDLADEMGILLWSEFEFGDALYPVDEAFLANVREEVVYQVRRVNQHPSLAYWAGGNELENLELPTAEGEDPASYPRLLAEYETLFLSLIFPAVFENSRSISYSPSSTSNGFITLNFTEAPYMQERYYDLPTPAGHIYGDTDHYNYNSTVAFDLSSYPVGRFSNEFGFHSMPSLQTWQDYVPESELHFNSTTILLRNKHYPAGGLFTNNFANSSKGMGEMTMAAQRWYPVPNTTMTPSSSSLSSVDMQTSLANFSAWCLTTQIFQADYYGSQIQFYKRGMGQPQRTLGNLYWQLEDQWAAPTWAGIEVSGRWKVLHYRAKDLYQPVIVSPFYNTTTDELEVWVTSDLWGPVTGTVSGQWYSYNGTLLSTLTTQATLPHEMEVQVGALNSTQVYQRANISSDFSSSSASGAAADAVLRLNVTVTGQRPNSKHNITETFHHVNWFHPTPLSSANLVDPGLTLSHGANSNGTNSFFTVTATQGISAWTWLDYPRGALITFSDNGFFLMKGESRRINYTVVSDTTEGKWIDGVTVWSLWNNTRGYDYNSS